jgi:hypothetical protein
VPITMSWRARSTGVPAGLRHIGALVRVVRPMRPDTALGPLRPPIVIRCRLGVLLGDANVLPRALGCSLFLGRCGQPPARLLQGPVCLGLGPEPLGRTLPIIGPEGLLRRDENPGIPGSPSIQRFQLAVVRRSFSKLGDGFVILRDLDHEGPGAAPGAPAIDSASRLAGPAGGKTASLERGMRLVAGGPVPSISPRRGQRRSPWRSSTDASSSGEVAWEVSTDDSWK